jgi:hypothetical protein
MISLRSEDSSFYPGDPNFEFLTPGKSVFLNHAYAGGDHSFILGNISSESAEILIPIDELSGVKTGTIISLEDKFTGTIYPVTGGNLSLTLEGFQGIWLKVPHKAD